MASVQLALSAGDASPAVIEQEKQIEADLEELLQAMKRMPGSRLSNQRGQRGQRDRQRELNRLLAELRMLRMLQVKINKETTRVDGQRPQGELPPPLAQALEKLTERQDDLRDATQRLADERADELGGGQ
jgi:septal ring factor EnvC (AmiA/AmiB activator)